MPRAKQPESQPQSQPLPSTPQSQPAQSELQSLVASLPNEIRELLRGLLEAEPGSTSPGGSGTGSGGGAGSGGGSGGSGSGSGSSGGTGGGTGRLYRQRIYHLVPYGHFEEVLSLCEQLNALARARGGTGGTLWIPTIGQQNELIVEFEFDSLATFEEGRAATNSDPEWTELVRRIGQAVVPGSVRTELVETAPHLA
jgi:hypothetical protein